MADQRARSDDNGTLGLNTVFPEDQVGKTGFILNGDEHHPLCRAGALAHQHQPGDRDTLAIPLFGKGTAEQDAAFC